MQRIPELEKLYEGIHPTDIKTLINQLKNYHGKAWQSLLNRVISIKKYEYDENTLINDLLNGRATLEFGNPSHNNQWVFEHNIFNILLTYDERNNEWIHP